MVHAPNPGRRLDRFGVPLALDVARRGADALPGKPDLLWNKRLPLGFLIGLVESLVADEGLERVLDRMTGPTRPTRSPSWTTGGLGMIARDRCGSAVRLISLLLFTSVAAGCGAARSTGASLADGAVERLTERESTLIAIEQRLADSVGAYLSREFSEAVIAPARETWDTMVGQVRAEADSSSVRLAEGVQGPLSEALQELLERSFDVIETRANRLGRSLPDAMTPALERGLATSFGAVGDTLAHHLSAGLATGLQEQFRPALHALMRDLTDSLRARVTEIDRTVAESSTVSGARSFLVGSAVALALVAALTMLLSWRRHRRALHAMLDAVQLTDDERMHEAVRGCAGQAGVEDWLAARAVSRRRRKGDRALP